LTSASGLPAMDFWAITSYFNPMGYKRRFSNYKVFRKNLSVPLVAVELAYSNAFELQEGDADILVRLRGGAVLWQKERLLNVALQALPKSCRKVAWLDCDIIFQMVNWAGAASQLLDRVPMIQPFKRAHYLRPDQGSASLHSSVALAASSCPYVVSSGLPATEFLGQPDVDRVHTAIGLAWAARREFLDRHGFYDAGIVGGGDRQMACAAYDCIDEVMAGQFMNSTQRQRYRAWAEPVRAELKADIAFIDGDVLHLWYGDMSDRAWKARHEGLQQFRFDPFHDIAIEENGCWRWNSDKLDMHQYVRDYFFSRREDGLVACDL